MIIREIDLKECYEVLGKTRLARLACSQGNQPYIIPVYLTFHHPSGGNPFLYGFSTPGRKISCMRANPLVCVEVDDIEASDDWASIIILGRFEELLDTPGENGEQYKAWEVLRGDPEWWEPGSSPHVPRNGGEPIEEPRAIYFRIRIDEMTGHKVFKNARHDIYDVA